MIEFSPKSSSFLDDWWKQIGNIHSSIIQLIYFVVQCRVELEKTRLLVLEAADQLDRNGNKKARGIIAMAKVNQCCLQFVVT